MGGGGSSVFDTNPGMLSGLGGLGGAGYTPQPGSSLDWTRLFGGGGGGGGGGGMQQAQQPPIDYGSLFGRGVGGTGVAPSSTDQTAGWGNAPAAMPDPNRLLGYDPNKVFPATPSGPDRGMDPNFWIPRSAVLTGHPTR
jgi:hypothetical protein